MFQVLLVEDDRTNLKMYEMMSVWEEEGFCIAGKALNGAEALRMLENTSFDLLIVDVVMPIMDGIAFLETIRERKISAKRIIVSNYNEFEYVRQGMKFGASDYLLKPVTDESLRSCLRDVRDELEKEREYSHVEEIFFSFGVDMSSKFTQKIMAYFREHKDLNLTDLSEEFNLSKDYFGKLFKRQMNDNFNQFVFRFKMEYAKKMLCESEKRIYEIGNKLGYRTTDYFSKMFRDYTGETPSEYRKNHQ